MKKLILLVDDDAAILNILGDILEFEGYQVAKSCNGEEGLKSYLSSRPSLIISDVMMPALGGFELLKMIRNDHGDGLTPIILMSGGIFSTEVGGCNYFLQKPLSLDRILELVEELI